MTDRNYTAYACYKNTSGKPDGEWVRTEREEVPVLIPIEEKNGTLSCILD